MNIPEYVREEIENYRLEKANNRTAIITYERAKAFVGLAFANGWFSEEEKEKLYREIESI